MNRVGQVAQQPRRREEGSESLAGAAVRGRTSLFLFSRNRQEDRPHGRPSSARNRTLVALSGQRDIERAIDGDGECIADQAVAQLVKPGDAAGVFLPLVPEAVIVMYACFKTGVAVLPVFSGFGPEGLAERLAHAEAKILFTVDGAVRRSWSAPRAWRSSRAC
ncbi:MAG TPA: hypothetical protein EYQ83_13065 [Acidobacteria bacterium]|nr:hypothetical protein [Acidobacteriota bacterium]